MTGSLPPSIILASASPRRAELLARLGLSFQIAVSNVLEDLLEGEGPSEHTERLSREKALAVSEIHTDALVLAGDTVVVLDGVVLGKPADRQEAVRMLSSLAGRTHRVISGLALVSPGKGLLSGFQTTEVTFRPFDEGWARDYVETGEPMDKAGAYGIQGLGSALVQGIRGDYHTVMGLPVPLLLDLLLQAGWSYEFGRLVPSVSPESLG